MGFIQGELIRAKAFSNQGMSVIEVLIAFVVIAFVALASASFFNHQRNLLSNFTPGGECKAILQGQMDYFRQQGMAPTGLPWKDDPSIISMSDPTRYQDRWAGSGYRFGSGGPLPKPLVSVSTTTPNKVEISNYTLQRGSMGLLNALYNRVPGICMPGGVDPTSVSGAPVFSPYHDILTFKSTLQIDRYDLKTGNVVGGCTNPLATQTWLRPQGTAENDPAKPYVWAPDIKAGEGFRVTLTASYKDRSKDLKNCSLTEDFSYPVDKEVQSLSVIWSTQVTGAAGGSISPPEADPGTTRAQCTQPPGKPAGLTLKIGFVNPTLQPVPVETGTVFMCRDISEQMNLNYCEDMANDPKHGVNASMEGQNYNPANPQAQQWVPCSQVTACGIPPTSFSTIEDPHVPGSLTYQLQYDNSKATSKDGLWGCDIRIDVASVDLAGNYKLLSNTPGASIAHRYFQPTDCYRCYKKKKKNWGAFVISTIAFGPFASCLAGVGGVCGGSGLTYVGYSCKNTLPGATTCKKVTPNRPSWASTLGSASVVKCPAKNVTLPYAYGGATVTIPENVDGGVFEKPIFLNDIAGYCQVQASCEGGVWEGLPDENDNISPFVECGKVLVRHKIDISGKPIGVGAPAGVQECVTSIPDGSNPFTPDESMYSPFSVCGPGTTGLPYNALCFLTGSPPHPKYPVNAMTGAANNVDTNQYYYFKQIVPTPTSLPGCP